MVMPSIWPETVGQGGCRSQPSGNEPAFCFVPRGITPKFLRCHTQEWTRGGLAENLFMYKYLKFNFTTIVPICGIDQLMRPCSNPGGTEEWNTSITQPSETFPLEPQVLKMPFWTTKLWPNGSLCCSQPFSTKVQTLVWWTYLKISARLLPPYHAIWPSPDSPLVLSVHGKSWIPKLKQGSIK